MGRYALRYTGGGQQPSSVAKQVRALRDVTILDESPRMLFVEGSEAQLKELVDSLPDWLMVEERQVPLPDPRQKLKGTA
jgi:hypothetical protein